MQKNSRKSWYNTNYVKSAILRTSTYTTRMSGVLTLLGLIKSMMDNLGLSEVFISTLFQASGHPHHGWGLSKALLQGVSFSKAIKLHGKQFGFVLNEHKLQIVEAADAAATGAEAEASSTGAEASASGAEASATCDKDFLALLATLSPGDQLQKVGDRLYKIVVQFQPLLARKIVGHLLAGHNDLLGLLEDPALLKRMVALVLKNIAAAGNSEEEHKEQLSDAGADATAAAAASPATVYGAALCTTDDGEEEHKKQLSDAEADSESSANELAKEVATSVLSSDGTDAEEHKESGDGSGAGDGAGAECAKDTCQEESDTDERWKLLCKLRRKKKELFEEVEDLIAKKREATYQSRLFNTLGVQIGKVFTAIKSIEDQIEKVHPRCECCDASPRLFFHERTNSWNQMCARCYDKSKQQTPSGTKTVGRMATCGKRGNRLMQLHG